MATTVIVPNSASVIGTWSGNVANIDEGCAAPNDADLMSSTTSGATLIANMTQFTLQTGEYVSSANMRVRTKTSIAGVAQSAFLRNGSTTIDSTTWSAGAGFITRQKSATGLNLDQTDLNNLNILIDCGAGTSTKSVSCCDIQVTTSFRAPAATINPSISGTVAVGGTLTCSSGSWSDTDTIAFAWFRDGVFISGETTSTYTIQSGDVGTAITCLVTAANPGSSASYSAATTPSTIPAPSSSNAIRMMI